MSVLVDERCAMLASEFLNDEEQEGYRHVLTDANITELAARIQHAVDDFLLELPSE